jgi:hypothetical protein
LLNGQKIITISKSVHLFEVILEFKIHHRIYRSKQ